MVWLVGCGRRAGAPPEAGQIKHLHAMARGLADNISPVVVDLDVSPCARRSGRTHCADDPWLCWVCNVNEAGAFTKANDGIFMLSGRISPPSMDMPSLAFVKANDGIFMLSGRISPPPN